MGKSVHIIPIARGKLQKRGISEDQVRQAVEQPDEIVTGHGGRRVAHRKVAGQSKEYLLRVVYEDRPEGVVVITAYRTSEIARYWRGKQ